MKTVELLHGSKRKYSEYGRFLKNKFGLEYCFFILYRELNFFFFVHLKDETLWKNCIAQCRPFQRDLRVGWGGNINTIPGQTFCTTLYYKYKTLGNHTFPALCFEK